MQPNRTFLFVFMHCKVWEVVFCHSISVLAELLGLMMMSHAYPLLSLYFKYSGYSGWMKWLIHNISLGSQESVPKNVEG